MIDQQHDEQRPRYPEIIVKFVEGGRLEEREGIIVGDGEIITLKQFYETLETTEGAVARRSFRTDTETLHKMRDLASERLGRILPSLDLVVRVRLPDNLEVDITELVQKFADDPEVNFATLAGIPGPLPATPDLSFPHQDYLMPGPVGGVGARVAWTFPNGDGTGIRVCICERGFNPDHEDLDVSDPGDVDFLAIDGDLTVDEDHGTHTLGVLGAKKPAPGMEGVTGICHGATLKFASETGTLPHSNRIDCLDAAFNTLNVGDVIVLEMQGYFNGSSLVPVEYSWEIRQRIMQEVFGLGKVVVAAAGNGDTDLKTVTWELVTSAGTSSGLHIWDPDGDPVIYDADGNYVGGEYDDSGAIIVGAGFSIYSTDLVYETPHSRLFPSNYGHRVNCQGWGESVATTGGGELYTDDVDSDGVLESAGHDKNATYTKAYGGTSSATAMVAGVVACLQGAVKAAKGAPLLPEIVRDLLADPTIGTPQADSDDYLATDYPIGPLPDLSRLVPAELFKRDPIDLELVMDVSSSMNNPPPGDPMGDSKLFLMRQACSIVTDFVNDQGQSSDHMGLIWFSEDVEEYESAGQKLFEVQSNVGTLRGQINTHGSGSCTAMGAGLQTAFDTLAASPRQPFIILCTDGRQNIEPKVTQVGTHYEVLDSGGWLCGSHATVLERPGIDIASYNTPVHTIGIGVTTAYSALLQDMANETAGFYIGTDAPDVDLDLAYLVTLCNTMAGGSPAVAHHSIGRLLPETARTSEYFHVNRSVQKVTVILSWKARQQSAMTFWLYAPDGTLLEVHPRMKHFESYCLVTFPVPYRQNGRSVPYVGQWRMVICGELQGPHADFHAFVVVDDPVTKFRLDYQRDRYVVGDSLPLQINLLELQEPVLRVNDISLETVYQQVPLAELFARYEVSDYELDQWARTNRSALAKPPMLLKLEMMARDPHFQQHLRPKRDRVSLLAGDLACKINTEAILTPISLQQPGLHTFKVTVQSETPGNGRLNRVGMISVYVEPGKVDRKQTEAILIEVSKYKHRGKRLRVRPRNKYGQLMGPGYGGEFKAMMSRKPLEIEVDDLLDGSYEIEMTLSDEERRNISKKGSLVNLMFQRISVWKGTI